jgi:hypothetical protein
MLPCPLKHKHTSFVSSQEIIICHASWTQQKGIGGPTMSQPTRPKDTGQEAHNRGGLEDNYRIKSYK